MLNLNEHNLYGQIPEALGQMTALEQFMLDGNQLSGRLPTFLADMPGLRYVWLGNNVLTGPLPHAWCNGSWWMFSVANNSGERGWEGFGGAGEGAASVGWSRGWGAGGMTGCGSAGRPVRGLLDAQRGQHQGWAWGGLASC